MKVFLALTIVCCFLISFTLPTTLAEECGWQQIGQKCPEGSCCSQWGWCGTTDEYCCVCDACQWNCRFCSHPPHADVLQLISKPAFDKMLLYRNHSRHCADGCYTYDAFITAAKSFPSFAATGNIETRRREIAAFLAHTLHGPTGDWSNENDAINYFKTGMLLWMSPESSKPSYHQLITNKWNFTSSFINDE